MNPSAAWRHETPRIGTKYDYAKAHGQAQRTAQKRLTAMHKRGEVWVSGWAKQLHQWVPIYSLGSGTDVPKPAPVSGAERSRRYRAKPPGQRVVRAAPVVKAGRSVWETMMNQINQGE